MNQNNPVPAQSHDPSAPFFWWPPDFPGVRLNEGVEEPAPLSTDPEDLGPRLAQSYETIEQQREHISRLAGQISQLEDAVDEANARTRHTHRCWRRLVKAMILLPCLSVAVIFHREVAQVGWNFFCGACGVFALAPARVAGLLTSGAIALLFWKIAKATFHAAREDLFGPDEEELE